MSDRGKKSGSTKNGEVMVPRGEVPLYPVRQGGGELLVAVSYAINFLRNDHPAAQIAMVDSSWFGTDGSFGKERARESEEVRR